jgi:hypothetical protein
MSLRVQDRAGNDTTLFIRVLKQPSPIPAVFQVRLPSGAGLRYPTVLDTTPAPSLADVRSIVSAGSSLVRALNFEDAEHVFVSGGAGALGYKAFAAHRNQPIDFLFVPQTNASLASLSVQLDGATIDTSAFREYDDILKRHPNQLLVRVTPRAAHHRMVFRATDILQNTDSLVLMLDDSLVDRQVVDSASDNNGIGADWGEVYMRRNVYQPMGFSLPQTWDYWLIQRRNSMVPGERDNHIYRLLADADGDSATGDTTSVIPRGFKGADVALEWTNLSTADDGSAAQVTMYRWNDTLKHWIQAASGHEGQNLLAGYAFHQNEPDNPNTDSLGRGDQRLPSGVVAPASGGVTEIGIRSGLTNSLQRIRWAIIPDGFAGDTVRAASGGMLKFEPDAKNG